MLKNQGSLEREGREMAARKITHDTHASCLVWVSGSQIVSNPQMSLRSAWVSTSSLFIAIFYSVVWTDHILSFPQLGNDKIWVVSTFCLLQITLQRTFLHRFLCGRISFGFIPGSDITRSMFNLWKTDRQTVFQSGCAILRLHQ